MNLHLEYINEVEQITKKQPEYVLLEKIINNIKNIIQKNDFAILLETSHLNNSIILGSLDNDIKNYLTKLYSKYLINIINETEDGEYKSFASMLVKKISVCPADSILKDKLFIIELLNLLKNEANKSENEKFMAVVDILKKIMSPYQKISGVYSIDELSFIEQIIDFSMNMESNKETNKSAEYNSLRINLLEENIKREYYPINIVKNKQINFIFNKYKFLNECIDPNDDAEFFKVFNIQKKNEGFKLKINYALLNKLKGDLNSGVIEKCLEEIPNSLKAKKYFKSLNNYETWSENYTVFESEDINKSKEIVYKIILLLKDTYMVDDKDIITNFVNDFIKIMHEEELNEKLNIIENNNVKQKRKI